jgi:GNAT superfamily N-acetyltransferase
MLGMQAGLSVELRRSDELLDTEREEIRALARVAWGPPEVVAADSAVRRGVVWATDYAWQVLVREADGLLISHAAVVERAISVNGASVRVGGLAAVITHPERRRRGAARLAVRCASEMVCNQLGAELALLFSSEMGVPLYTSLGWRPVAGPVMCAQPQGTLNWTEELPSKPVLALACKGQVPDGAIDVRGLPW